ncbi:uncharacterized protein BX663DRAFT_537990 [Cokeromyces recurvatus]|uniref:uncharacterized protein n=1 Tax=Cokeromyces recurvatus TaxID=90255 RepID=UPI00221E792D|nr:uncharacterized protein BX663DRAFT_537990 [Cokeromyces recurvatus]KAI7899472.1 hypothetical protein BX663DRAFT_537990 [Cokeromyces recurvatus]
MSTININVRPSTGQIFKLDVGTEATIEELKQLIAQKMENVEASNLKLVFSGRILKNEDLVGDCKIVSGCTVHVVRTGTNKAPAAKNNNSNSTATTATNTLENTTSTNSAANITSGQQSTTSNPSSGLLGASSPFGALGDMQMPNMDPELMRQMMDSPFMQNILNNPEFVRSIIMSNPQMKALVEQNPELGHVISDPAFLRQSMEMMRNPNLMREMQRNNDRALSNIEAIPGGFNHLRRMYNTFQGPLESAMSPRESNTNDEAINERLARELNVESVPENSLNTQALPNPWAAPSNRSNNDSSSTTTTTTAAAAAATTNPFGAAFSGSANNTGAMENPFAALFGAGNAFPLSQQQQQQQQQQTPFWADPNFIQASLRLQQAMMSAQNNNNNNSQQQPNLFQQMFMGGFPSNNGFGFPTTQPATSTEPPEVRFREQLAQLEEMGFTDKSANIRALLATGGNVQAAVEYLLSM